MSDRSTTFRRGRAAWLLAAVALPSGCLTQDPPGSRDAAGPLEDPNASTTVVAPDESVKPPVRMTLMDENEELRELLSEALAEKRRLEAELQEHKLRADSLDRQVTDLQAAVDQLTTRLEQETRRSMTLESELKRNEAERKALAEMYVAEKHQRLVFEKELLEQEIRARTRGKKGGS